MLWTSSSSCLPFSFTFLPHSALTLQPCFTQFFHVPCTCAYIWHKTSIQREGSSLFTLMSLVHNLSQEVKEWIIFKMIKSEKKHSKNIFFYYTKIVYTGKKNKLRHAVHMLHNALFTIDTYRKNKKQTINQIRKEKSAFNYNIYLLAYYIRQFKVKHISQHSPFNVLAPWIGWELKV